MVANLQMGRLMVASDSENPGLHKFHDANSVAGRSVALGLVLSLPQLLLCRLADEAHSR